MRDQTYGLGMSLPGLSRTGPFCVLDGAAIVYRSLGRKRQSGSMSAGWGQVLPIHSVALRWGAEDLRFCFLFTLRFVRRGKTSRQA